MPTICGIILELSPAVGVCSALQLVETQVQVFVKIVSAQPRDLQYRYLGPERREQSVRCPSTYCLCAGMTIYNRSHGIRQVTLGSFWG